MTLSHTENIILKKEYMNRQDLTEVILPAHIIGIGDWAFANCERLAKIYLPTSVQTMGQNIFLGCPALRDIVVYDTSDADITVPQETRAAAPTEAFAETLSRLTAIAFTCFNLPALRCLRDIGSYSWLSMWDDTLLQYLHQPDDEGFDPFLAGGEEDYEDKNSNPDYFCHIRRIQKVTCILERLLIEKDYPLSPRLRTQLSDYLAEYSFWSPEDGVHAETIDVLLLETQRISSIYKLYKEMRLFEHVHIADFISTLPPEQVELKALLISHSSPCDYGFYL